MYSMYVFDVCILCMYTMYVFHVCTMYTMYSMKSTEFKDKFSAAERKFQAQVDSSRPKGPRYNKMAIPDKNDLKRAIVQFYDLLESKNVHAHPSTSCHVIFAKTVSEDQFNRIFDYMGIPVDPDEKFHPYGESMTANPTVPTVKVFFKTSPAVTLNFEYHHTHCQGASRGRLATTRWRRAFLSLVLVNAVVNEVLHIVEIGDEVLLAGRTLAFVARILVFNR